MSSQKIYVVQDYDTVTYAGTNFKNATAKVKGSNWIQIWQDGKYVGYYKYQFGKGWVKV
jgi:hypothetical protein